VINVDVALGPLHLIELIPKTTCKSVEQTVASREHDVGEHLALDILITTHYALVNLFVDSLHVTLAT
jgi:hypothetical protein